MNKTKLEVIRINEDVIATSGANCDYLAPNYSALFKSSSTILVSTSWLQAPVSEGYMKNGDSFQFSKDMTSLNVKNTSVITIQKNHWYHFDGTNITECPNPKSHNYNN